MSTIKNFEELKCWQNARVLVNQVYDIIETLPKDKFGLIDQIERASISIMNNISEGFGRFSNKDFVRFLDYSHGSSNEVKNLTYLLEHRKYISNKKGTEIRELIEFVKSQILGLIKHLAKSFKPKNVSEPAEPYNLKTY